MAKSLRRQCRRFGNEQLKIDRVFKRFLETVSDGADVTFCGAKCSTVGKWRLEKLDRQRLKNGCVGQQAIMTKQSRDADGPRR